MKSPQRQTLKVLFSEDMVSSSGAFLSPSDRKPGELAKALLATSWPIELVAPRPAGIDAICRVHDPDFVEEVLQLRRSNGFGTISASVARSLPYTCGACFDAALVALQEGISASLTSGFHHAGPRRSFGFCTLNGLMVCAMQLLDQGHARKVAIVDGDFHYGDGTQAIVDELGIADKILHVSFGATYRRPEQAAAYLTAVAGLRAQFEAFEPTVVLYQAGADVHTDDPLGGLLTTAQMRERDRTLFTIAKDLGIALTWNLVGGYQVERDGSIPRVLALHLNTFEEALAVWGLCDQDGVRARDSRAVPADNSSLFLG
jgi:acetoin utilization deacetylase AcuC-like enzyme